MRCSSLGMIVCMGRESLMFTAIAWFAEFCWHPVCAWLYFLLQTPCYICRVTLFFDKFLKACLNNSTILLRLRVIIHWSEMVEAGRWGCGSSSKHNLRSFLKETLSHLLPLVSVPFIMRLADVALYRVVQSSFLCVHSLGGSLTSICLAIVF